MFREIRSVPAGCWVEVSPDHDRVYRTGPVTRHWAFPDIAPTGDREAVARTREVVEAAASCDLYPVLKREDEKFVTEKAFDNPRFVEDIVREVALILRKDSRIKWFHVEVENFESIHSHNAYALVEETCG